MTSTVWVWLPPRKVASNCFWPVFRSPPQDRAGVFELTDFRLAQEELEVKHAKLPANYVE